MGASFESRTYPDSLGRKVIVEKWDEAVDQSQYEHGHSYSGEIGMLNGEISLWHDANLPSAAAADEWLSENQVKWQGPMAVSFSGPENCPDERMVKIQVFPKIVPGKPAKFWMIGGWCAS